LFAVDAAGGGLVTTGFLSYYFAERYHVSVVWLGWLFFAVSVVQAVSVALAPLLACRFGLVATMVGTHLPSNLLLAAVAFAPTFPVAALLLLARTTLSQMDVPTRQALVMTVVTPRRTHRRRRRHERLPLQRAAGRPADRWPGAAARPRRAAGRRRGGQGRIRRDAVGLGPPPRPDLPQPPGSAWGCRYCLIWGVIVIVCLRTVVVPPEWHKRYLAWIADGRAIRQQHGIVAELVCEPATPGGETVVITVWPSHEVFDAWIATPHRDALTASEVHQAVSYRPITRYEKTGGYLNLPGLTVHDLFPQPVPEEPS
jgi:hypothetical protein